MDLSPDDDDFTGRLLHQAALWDNVDLLKELLANGGDVHSIDAACRTALHAAALNERSACLVPLCEAGIDVNAVSDVKTGGATALHISSERGHVENVKVLLKYGATFDVKDASGSTALMLAERASHRHAAQALREHRDALERERLSKHTHLRELVVRNQVQDLKDFLKALGEEAGLIVNLTSGGANTLLYLASEAGSSQIVSILLDAGADGRAHPVTKYCPLYIACYRGHLETVNVLLGHFPEAVQQETVEKWLPLHAACIGGHPNILNLLLEYKYPEHLLNVYSDPLNQWKYKFAFDINSCDVSGQTALYVACTLGNVALVDILCRHTVVKIEKENDSENQLAQVTSPHRSGISLGIHAIVSKLTGQAGKYRSNQVRASPLYLEGSSTSESPLAAAVRAGHTETVKILLKYGASANGVARAPNLNLSQNERQSRRSRSVPATSRAMSRASPSPSPNRESSENKETTWSPLSLAAFASNVQMIELLLNKGATDQSGAAMRLCVKNSLRDVIPLILATKAYPDPDFKINRGVVSETVFSSKNHDSLTYSALCPTSPVIVNWRELKCQFTCLRMKWLSDAALHINCNIGSETAALHAITRLDVSNNELRSLPAELFTMLSLRYINAAQNKLERLPSPDEPFEEDLDRNRKSRRKSNRKQVYSAPVLQDLYLQDNRLEELPPELFNLPSLSCLDVSNNKIRSLPGSIWTAPKLKELNASLNHLKELPVSDVIDSNMDIRTFVKSPSITSRSSSIDQSVDSIEEDLTLPVLGNRATNAVSSKPKSVNTWRGATEPTDSPQTEASVSSLISLNLSHNQFTCIPPVLACRADSLQRLNMAYNSLRTMSYVTSYPTTLRQLDLSHNEITCWPSLPQIENYSSSTPDPLACYCVNRVVRTRPKSGASVRSQLLNAACANRRHLRLDSLRTLILANNMLANIQLSTDDDGLQSEISEYDNCCDDDNEWSNISKLKNRLLYPHLSMLDISSNMLRSIPRYIYALTNLAVLNISGNKEITDLPPQMGLLSRLWNLNAVGCSLHQPLAGMISSGKYRSMDVVGYLKSLLQEATPYASMKLMIVGLQGIGKTSLLDCLRQESATGHRKKHTEHWTKRMGNKASFLGNISTVGVDIGHWSCERVRSPRGPILFNTWDFGGQREYYSTHMYFLSKRSLYLVVWKATDGRKGLAGALDWLRSIQARAPGSPVIMVATHYDQVNNSNLPESESPEALQRLIRTSIMGVADADKLGLPRVLDTVEVSCSTRHNIRLLADIIYTVAFSIKPPGSKEPLLEQRVPATYLALEECVTHLASELKEPVLNREEYKRLVTQYMQQKNHRMFRDAAEFHQATMFLHENGILLHYDDATLKELYFLKPQWLCDVLAHVVTVKEINPFAASGIMKIEDLSHVFKASPQLARGDEASTLGVSLLNKFELALCWDTRHLLVPPLLPNKEPKSAQLPLSSRRHPRTPRPTTMERVDSPTLVEESPPLMSTSPRPGSPLRRLFLLSYVPCGFWPRLICRLLADEAMQVAYQAYTLPNDIEIDEQTQKSLELNWGWRLYKTGLSLVANDIVLLSLKEYPSLCDELLGSSLIDNEEVDEHMYYRIKFRIKQDGSWCDLDLQSSSCVEIYLPGQVCVARREDGAPLAGYQSISLEPNLEVLTKILALVTDHVDLLLEDWYPSLGTRFVHTAEGRCLITRLVPCPSCLKEPSSIQMPVPEQVVEELGAFGLGDIPRRVRVSQESRHSDGDSGVGADSNASSRVGSIDRAPPSRVDSYVYGWTIEQCIYYGRQLHCPLHTESAARVCPDTLLLDIEESKRAKWEEISLFEVIGRGAFGTVMRARWKRLEVALKALQPIEPVDKTDRAAMQAYKALNGRWQRCAVGGYGRAYSALRQELSVLKPLRHVHVLRLRAVCARPLALLLDKAPKGALDTIIREARAMGTRFMPRVLRLIALQVARALEYLHAKRIVYRDLKSENVLVWAMPATQQLIDVEKTQAPIDVHLKLGDYGISRLCLPSGTKGFGGTEGYMAPEIMKYNGEEEYNEKVDCFSFGMLVYEVLSLRQPFEGHEAVKDAILDGARPALTNKELQHPICILESISSCWSSPCSRPSAAALVCITASPEYTGLSHITTGIRARVACAVPLLRVDEDGTGGWEIWSAENNLIQTLTTTSTQFIQQYTVHTPQDSSTESFVTAMCSVSDRIWVGESTGRVCVYSISSLSLLWSARVTDTVGGSPSEVTQMVYLEKLNRVAVAMHCGRLFLVTSEQPEAEGNFVLSELGNATELSTLAVVPAKDGYEVWAGGVGLYSYTIGSTGVNAAESMAVDKRVAILEATSDETIAAYYKPGCCVYQWSVKSREAIARLDCSKLVPCSESLQSIAIEEHLSEENCQVTSMRCFGSELYVGTAWGCIIVAEAETLRPITVFRPYDANVSAILPLPSHKSTEWWPMILTIGTGYRTLTQRFITQANMNAALCIDVNPNDTHYMAWRAVRWLPD